MTYDFDAFASDHGGCTPDQVLIALHQELMLVEYKLRGPRRARARAAGAEGYRQQLVVLRRALRASAGRAPLSRHELTAMVLPAPDDERSQAA